jgi:hypothetical protein
LPIGLVKADPDQNPCSDVARARRRGYIDAQILLRTPFLRLELRRSGHPHGHNTEMATLHTTIPDDLSRQVHSVARARGIPVRLLVEEALRCVVSPEPFASDAEAIAEMEAMESDVLKDLPWEK